MLQPSNTPIIFIHYGKSDQLELAIRQAKHTNPATPIYLLGDNCNKYLSNLVQHYNFETFKNADSQLRTVYRHLSPNPFNYEYFCFNRWFLLLEFMNSTQLDWVCTLDSDFLLYEDISLFVTSNLKQKNLVAGFCVPDQQFDQYFWCGSGHISFISLRFLKSFCGFVIHMYEDTSGLLERKIEFHNTQGLPGGICDMTSLYLYYLKYQDSLLNLLLPFEDKVFDIGIGTTDNFISKEFTEKNGFKDVHFRMDLPYCVSNKTKQEVYFRGLHFQGTAKNRMHQYYTAELCLSLIREKLRFFYYSARSWIKFKIT